MRRNSQTIKFILLVSPLILLLAGCASYPHRMARIKHDFVRGDYEKALAAIDPDDCEGGGDQLLFLLERATIKQNMGDFEGSNRDFETAYDVIRDYENRPGVSIRDMSSEIGAALVNETTLAYKGYGFEKMLVHIFKALNYLMLGDLEGAGVEIRRLDERRKIELKEHERAIGDARMAAHEQQIEKSQLSDITGKLLQAYGPAQALAESVTNLYLSAFGSYLSALHYDLEGSYSEALIDCRRVIAQVPSFESARTDAVSLGADDIRASSINLDLTDSGDLILFFQCGLSPVKKEIFIPIPTGRGLMAVAFPVYQAVPTKLEWAVVYIDGREAGRTRMLSNIEAKQIRNLIDQIPVLIVRQIVRAVVKGVALRAASKEGGGWGELAMSLYNVLSEHADLRSWLLLPRNIQALRLYPPEGKHNVRIALIGRGGSPLGDVSMDLKFRNDQTHLVNLRGIGYTPLLPDGLTITEQWRAIPRVPLRDRPRTILGKN
ncbi:MAG: hypothetical protein RAO92_03395 [Candidatus Euphemobacter frigidus]|nr:hypothetical protein [Candidatus Euphemobacter frigidus]MDP8275426.1 hypothetical protein [Candidatus Euphemobacter frigidus]